MGCDVKDLGLALKGRERIEWAAGEMPVLALIRERFEKERPLDGVRIAACLHVTTETANLMETLAAGGAEVALCASNPLSTQDDVAAALCEQSGIATFAVKGEDTETFFRHINEVLDTRPHITMDDGADMVSVLHKERQDQIADIMGGTEETTTGVIRLRAMAADGALKYPIVSVNDADTKHLFDNRFGTGQSTIDAIMRSTNRLIAGRTVVVCGYGMCGRGVASRARGMGAHVIVTEVDPTCALEAVMEGYRVMPIREAARIGDMFVTVTGDTSVIRREHMELMKDGAILANSGHFDVEIDKLGSGRPRRAVSPDPRVRGRVHDGRRTSSPSAGRGPAGQPHRGGGSSCRGDGHVVRRTRRSRWSGSSRTMQTLRAEVYPVPVEIDKEVARLKLHAMGVEIDALTAEQDSLSALVAAGHLSATDTMDERVSIRAHFERFPATVKGAFVLRGRRSRSAPGANRCGACSRDVGHGARSRSDWSRSSWTWRRISTCSFRSSSAITELAAGWYDLECDVAIDGDRENVRPPKRFAVPWPRATVRRGNMKVDKTARVEGGPNVHVEQVECGGDTVRVAYTVSPAEEVAVRLAVDDDPLTILESAVRSGVGAWSRDRVSRDAHPLAPDDRCARPPGPDRAAPALTAFASVGGEGYRLAVLARALDVVFPPPMRGLRRAGRGRSATTAGARSSPWDHRGASVAGGRIARPFRVAATARLFQ